MVPSIVFVVQYTKMVFACVVPLVACVERWTEQIERELELQQTKEMLARLGKKADNVEKLDKSGREVRLTLSNSYLFVVLHFSTQQLSIA